MGSANTGTHSIDAADSANIISHSGDTSSTDDQHEVSMEYSLVWLIDYTGTGVVYTNMPGVLLVATTRVTNLLPYA